MIADFIEIAANIGKHFSTKPFSGMVIGPCIGFII